MSTIKIHKKDNYAILELARSTTNPINVAMMRDISQAMDELSQDTSVRGVIITGQPPFFSVGLDIKELLQLDAKTSKIFFMEFNRMIFQLVQFPKPMVCAITGHSPAGGCIIAICADFRIMVNEDKFKIGLNEVPVGIMVPPHILELYAFWVGKGKAYQYLLQGKLHTASEALACGLVDQLVPITEVLQTAEQKMQSLLKADEETLMGVKINLRHALIKQMIHLMKDTPIDTEQHFWKEGSQQRLKMLAQQLAKG